jgi:DNA-binding Lrp family transcriptional regulator
MTVMGFVLIKTEAGATRNVFNLLKDKNEITELIGLFGEYDLLAKIEANDTRALGRIILDEIRDVPDILSTKTLQTTAF